MLGCLPVRGPPATATGASKVLDSSPNGLYRPRMSDASPYEPAKSEEIEATLAEAIQSSAGGQMTRSAEVLAGICAKHLTEQLALAGFVFMRRLD